MWFENCLYLVKIWPSGTNFNGVDRLLVSEPT